MLLLRPQFHPAFVLHQQTTMKRRVTFVHQKNAGLEVKELLSTRLEFEQPVLGSLEERFSSEPLNTHHIKSIRIHINRERTNDQTPNLEKSVFAYPYQIGLHVYVEPELEAGVTLDDFFTEVNNHLQMQLGFQIPPEHWIQSLNAFYFHDIDIPKVNVPNGATLGDSYAALDYYSSSESTVTKLYKSDMKIKLYDVSNSGDSCEVGVFTIEDHSTRDDLILSGVRVLLNDKDMDAKQMVQRTVFHTKPRHRYLDILDKNESFSKSPLGLANVKIIPNGLHPILSIVSIPAPPTDRDIDLCLLFSYLTLQKSVFVDRYQVPDQVKLLAHYGTKDLELPEYSVKQWGTEVLLHLGDLNSLLVNLTLHSRYQLPQLKVDTVSTLLDSAVLFYACDATVDANVLTDSAFDNRRPVGGSFERFFTEDSIFYHVSERESLDVQIPTLKDDSIFINLSTMTTLIFGILMVLSSALVRSLKRKAKTE